MKQPLVSRPPYGEGRSRAPRAVAELPEGGPTHRGLPLDDSVPGHKTFVKPLDDNGTSTEENRAPDEPVYRVRNPRDIPKNRDRVDVIDQTDAQPHYMGLGQPHQSPKTKYPYRDDKPNTHNAAIAEFVAGLWLLRKTPDLFLPAGARVGVTLDTISQGLDEDIAKRSKACRAALRRADIRNLRWIFSVDCGNGAKVVRLKATRPGNVKQFTKLDLYVACSCPFWRWQGPEWHSTTKNYQDPKTPLQGTATPPNIRDPERDNKVCKHVASVLSLTKSWTIPQKK